VAEAALAGVARTAAAKPDDRFVYPAPGQTNPVPARLLPIYLNDHLAGATLGVELARRALRENAGSELGTFLEELLRELAEDRQTLIDLMASLRVPRSRTKTGGAWALEKIGRLKLNGELVRYSPLSRLLELEGLAAGIDAKRGLWLALREIADRDAWLGAARLEELAERARGQRERLEPHRLAAARAALA
jgi:predicted DNA-binding ribbon-helix-helix protein